MSDNSSVPNDIAFYAYDVRKRETNFFIKYVTADYLATGKIAEIKIQGD